MTRRAASGDDPMAGDSIAVDTTHAMKTASRYEKSEGRARGRFGRIAAPDDVQMADARTTMQTDRGDERTETARYEVDAHAVADAILIRLLAGRTLAPPRADDAR